MSVPSLDEPSLNHLYAWLDSIPFSRTRKSVTRDFSDGVLVAEICAHFLPPRCVDLRLFPSANSTSLKTYNWENLNKKVFCKFNFNVPLYVVRRVVACKAGAVEYVLINLRTKIDMFLTSNPFPVRFRCSSASRAGSTTSLRSDTDDNGGGQTDVLPLQNGAQFGTNGVTKINIPSDDYVPAHALHVAEQQLLEKQERIQAAEARVHHLEKLLELKDKRILNLTQRLERMSQCFNFPHSSKLSEPDMSPNGTESCKPEDGD